MGIPIGKLALYTGRRRHLPGLHPADLARRRHRQPGAPRRPALPRLAPPAPPRARVRRVRRGVRRRRQGRLPARAPPVGGLQAAQRASGILDRYRDVLPSFNDDIQGTAAVVLAGILAGLRHLGTGLADQRIVFLGAGAAAIGIARLVRAAMLDDGRRRRGDPAGDRPPRHARPRRRRAARPRRTTSASSPSTDERPRRVRGSTRAPALLEVVRRVHPTILIGTTATPGAFTRAGDPGDGRRVRRRPIVFPLSNPTSKAEATPEQVLAWTDGRALVATGSPFPPVELRRPDAASSGRRTTRSSSRASASARSWPGCRGSATSCFLVAARTLAGLVAPERLAAGALYPPVADLRAVSRAIAIACVLTAGMVDGLRPAAGRRGDRGGHGRGGRRDWWPDYPPYEPA